MDYGSSVKDVLLRKINKAERDLNQLKLDYCRFVFGLTHRSVVRADGGDYQVKVLHLDSMQRTESGEWTAPALAGIPVDAAGDLEPVELGATWELVS